MKPIRIGSFVRALSPFPLPSPSPGDDPLPHGRVEFIERYTDEWGTRTFIGVPGLDGPHIPPRDITRHSPHSLETLDESPSPSEPPTCED